MNLTSLSFVRRLCGLFMLLPLSAGIASCATGRLGSEDPRLTIHLVNSGSQPMHCRLMFGHWIDRDLGELAPGGVARIDAQRQKQDGALYVLREDGQRRMMIETILCGRDADWPDSVGLVDLAPARARQTDVVTVSCASPAKGQRVACTTVLGP
jgi:hypothetical protein